MSSDRACPAHKGSRLFYTIKITFNIYKYSRIITWKKNNTYIPSESDLDFILYFRLHWAPELSSLSRPDSLPTTAICQQAKMSKIKTFNLKKHYPGYRTLDQCYQDSFSHRYLLGNFKSFSKLSLNILEIIKSKPHIYKCLVDSLILFSVKHSSLSNKWIYQFLVLWALEEHRHFVLNH